MRVITPDQVPQDHPYYRTCSPAYRAYLHGCGLSTADAPGGFGWIKKLVGPLYLAKFERLPAPPEVPALKAAGFRKGWVVWVPGRTATVPAGWRKMWLRTHMAATGFSPVDADYAKRWNQRARRALKKFLASGAAVEPMSHEDFAAAFRATRVRHSFKSDYLKYFGKIVAIAPSTVRAWGVRFQGKVVAGLAVHDYASSSAHLVAFTSEAAKPLQAGTGLIDRWFSDSLTRGVRYVDFDHLRDWTMPADQQGYTDFKNNFVDCAVRYKDAYFKWVG